MTRFMKDHKLLTAAAAVTIAALVIAVGFFFSRVSHYETHFFPGTMMSGVDVSELTAEEAIEKVSDFVADYQLTVCAREDAEYEISGTSIGYLYVPNGEIEESLELQDGFLWISGRKANNEHEIQLDTIFDQKLLKQQLKALPCFQEEQMTAPENAQIALVDGKYTLVPEVQGTTIRLEDVFARAVEAVENGERELVLEEFYEKPEITSDDAELTACMKTLENYYGVSVTYTFGEQEPYELTNETIQTWLTVDDAYQVHVDDEQVTRFVQFMASTYNTFGDKRKFKTSLGDTLEVGGGDYGWVINKEKEKEQLYADLATGGHIEREPIYTQTAEKYGAYDIGNTYVEIDYTNQHLWYYENGTLKIDSDIVSGNLNRNNGSPDGIFKIVYKERNATLVGENYSTPVNYFMPYAYNVGIHDASWRETFGGQIYLTSGSHGCINMPPKVAEQLYEELATNTVVVAYYREKVYLTAENARISNAYSYISPEKYKELLKQDPTAVNPKPKKE